MDKIRTLLFTGGEIHDYKGVGEELYRTLVEDGRFKVTHIEEDLSTLEAPKLDPYEVIVFFYTVGEISDAQKNGLLNFVASGRGYVGVHSAADSFRNCPEYRAMVGGHFVTHPHFRRYQVSVADPEHPVMEGLPEEFFVEDEQYILDYDPRVHILASALWKGCAVPVAWVKPWGEGRVCYIALGHCPESCRDGNFKKMLCQGTVWAARGDTKGASD